MHQSLIEFQPSSLHESCKKLTDISRAFETLPLCCQDFSDMTMEGEEQKKTF